MFTVCTKIIIYSQESLRLSVGCLQQSVQVVLDYNMHLMLLEKEKLKITQCHSKMAVS